VLHYTETLCRIIIASLEDGMSHCDKPADTSEDDIMILVAINDVIRCGYYSKGANIKGVATIQE